MNFLFGLAQGIFSALVIFLIWYGLPQKLKHKLIAPKYRRYERPIGAFLAVVIGLGVTWNAAGTYGPRIALDRTRLPSSPETVEIEGGAEMTTRKHDTRVGQFDEKLENKP